jgi:hypothetical protein
MNLTMQDNPRPDPKPPIGLIPEKQWKEQITATRINAIHAAIGRYESVQKKIPPDWYEELSRLYLTLSASK